MPTIYVHDENHNRYEGMTREQIINAIVQAVEQGEITDLDDGFITKIKEQNGNNNIQLWIGTSAQFNALETKDENTLYILTDDDSADDWDQIAEDVEELGNEIAKIKDGTTRVGKASHANEADRAVTAGWATNTTSFSEPDYEAYRYGDSLPEEGFYHIYVCWYNNNEIMKYYDAGIVYYQENRVQPTTIILDFYAELTIGTSGSLTFKVGTTPSNMAADNNVAIFATQMI